MLIIILLTHLIYYSFANCGTYDYDYDFNNDTIDFDNSVNSLFRTSNLTIDPTLNIDGIVCPIDIDIDRTFYEKFGGDTGDEFIEVIDIMKKVVDIFDESFEGFLDIRLRYIVPDRTKIWTENSRDAGVILRDYAKYVYSLNRDSCANILMTNIDFSGSILGMAHVATACNLVPYGDDAGESYMTTTGVVGFKGLNYHESVVLTAHEIGHILGARHTCCTSGCDNLCFMSSECNPRSGKFIMYPTLATGKNSFKFSSCSVRDIKNTLLKSYKNNINCFENTESYSDSSVHIVFDMYTLIILFFLFFQSFN